MVEICKSNYYFAKWTLFPVIIKQNETFSVKFFFLETMMKKRTFYLKIEFGMLTHELIGYYRGSGPIQ
jgi:hypothetical protein